LFMRAHLEGGSLSRMAAHFRDGLSGSNRAS
jgi:hypothetical protein